MNTKNVLKLNELKSQTELIDKDSGYDLIFLNDFLVQANIGVYTQEKKTTQPLRINVVAKVKNPRNINDDNLQSVVCYNQISKKIKKIIKSAANLSRYLQDDKCKRSSAICWKSKKYSKSS